MHLLQFWIKNPQPPEQWTDILDCTQEGPAPMQCRIESTQICGDEDCLFVNVFTKDVNSSTPKPVIVWLHGGGFAAGSTSRDQYSPDYLMSKDIVYVSVAYRLGIFGFLSLTDPSLKIPGNAGLRDQILALKWIQQNISRFGGDPNNVTVMGQSAGAASIHILGLTNHAKGLFHRMICLSGSALCSWTLPPKKDWFLLVCDWLGYSGPDTERDKLQFLRGMSAVKISTAENSIMTKEDRYAGYAWAAYPVIEPYVSEQCLLPDDPMKLAADAWINDVPLIIGCTSREGMTFVRYFGEGVFTAWEVDLIKALPFDIKSKKNPEYCMKLAERIKNEHFDTGITDTSYIDYLSYKMFLHGVHRMVLSRRKYARAPTYLYNFEYDSADNGFIKNFMGLTYPGVAHADDLSYLFLGMLVTEPQAGSMDRKKIEEYVGMFSQFALTGDPNGSALGSVKWEPISGGDDAVKCLRFNKEITCEATPHAEKLAFWDSLYDADELF